MEHLQSFNELNKSTYHSVSRRLSSEGHKKRSKDMMDHAIKHGKDSVRERLYPHRFPNYSDVNEYYFICLVEITKLERRKIIFKIQLKSNWGDSNDRYKLVEFYERDTVLDLYDIKGSSGSEGKFESREDAKHFRRFLLEYLEEIKDSINKRGLEFDTVKVDVNKLYQDKKVYKKQDSKLNNFDLYYNRKSDK